MLVNDNGCPFCNEFNGRKELSYFEVMYGSKYDIAERCIFQTDNFSCVPSIGSFVEGYVLVVPKQHFLSVLTMPESHIKELLSIIRILASFYKSFYHQNFLIYEHGTADIKNVGGMSVVHAHLHFLPCAQKVISLFHEYEFLRFDSLFAAQKYYLENSSHPYLLLKDIDNSIYLAIAENIPSQYFRKKICDFCSLKGTGDWKEYPYIDNIKKTLATAKEFRIKELQFDCEGLYGTPVVR